MSTTTTNSTAAPTVDPGVLRRACDRIAPLWPLDHFVAVNPYMGLADRGFDDAARLLASTIGARTTLAPGFYLDALADGRLTTDDLAAGLAAVEGVTATDVEDLLQRVGQDDGSTEADVATVADVATAVTGVDWRRLADERVAAWAAARFDQGYAIWRSVGHTRSVFESWLEEARIDRNPDVMGLRGFRSWAAQLPTDHAAAAQVALAVLAVPEDGLDVYLDRVLRRLGGWTAHAAWIGWEAQLRGEEDDTLDQLLAVLLCWEAGLLVASGVDVERSWADARVANARVGSQPAADDRTAHRLVLQHAFDRAEQRRLVDGLTGGRQRRTDRPRAQVVFCIDVRSEVFRRHLEGVADDVDTLGFAGFFGMAIEHVPLAHGHGGAQCPALLTPGHTVVESLGDDHRDAEAAVARRLSHHVGRAWKSFKMGAITCFSFVGPVGLAYLPKLFTDGFGRTRPVPHPDDEGLPAGARSGRGPSLTVAEHGGRAVGIPVEDRIDLAEGALRGMSLTDGFAPLVLLAGHGATTVNNPYDTGLHCGACGGHTGAANARVAAMILNDPDVRTGLVARGIEIPDDTRFVPGLHDTTTDDLTLLVEDAGEESLVALRHDLAAAGARSRAERAPRLGIAPGGDVDEQVRRRSRDWAETRPEWGLAGCRAFVAAPRHRTRGIDLEGRSFLHEYDWTRDDGFAVLELIMTAPMVVASWISLQYHSSTVDNEVFGSGNKTLHNVVGRLGVLEGNAGDVRVGLPWQSIHDGERYQHEPVRLSVVIEAPLDAMNDVLASHPQVRRLVDNGWLQLLAMDGSGRVSHRYVGDLEWVDVAG